MWLFLWPGFFFEIKGVKYQFVLKQIWISKQGRQWKYTINYSWTWNLITLYHTSFIPVVIFSFVYRYYSGIKNKACITVIKKQALKVRHKELIGITPLLSALTEKAWWSELCFSSELRTLSNPQGSLTFVIT